MAKEKRLWSEYEVNTQGEKVGNLGDNTILSMPDGSKFVRAEDTDGITHIYPYEQAAENVDKSKTIESTSGYGSAALNRYNSSTRAESGKRNVAVRDNDTKAIEESQGSSARERSAEREYDAATLEEKKPYTSTEKQLNQAQTKANDIIAGKYGAYGTSDTKGGAVAKPGNVARTKAKSVTSGKGLSSGEKQAIEDEILNAPRLEMSSDSDDSDFSKNSDSESLGNFTENSSKKNASNFLKTWSSTHPTLFHAIFGKSVEKGGDNPLTFGQRVSLLGAALANLGANTIEGLKAGFNRQQFNGIQSNWEDAINQYSKQGIEKVLGAEQEQLGENLKTTTASDFVEANKSQIDKLIANKALMDDPGKLEEAIKGLGYHGDIKEMKDLIMSESKSQKIANAQKATLEIDNNINKLITDCNNEIQRLTELKSSLDAKNYSEIAGATGQLTGWFRGLDSTTSSVTSNSQWSATVGTGQGVPYVSASASGGHSWGDASGRNKDLKGLDGLDKALGDFSSLRNKSASDVAKAKAAIDLAIDDLKVIKQGYIDTQKQWNKKKKSYKVNDGIIKGDGTPQKIVKDDGTEIELNPNDNVYATKNELTSTKDNGNSVVPLNQSDKVQVKKGFLKGRQNPFNLNMKDFLKAGEEVMKKKDDERKSNRNKASMQSQVNSLISQSTNLNGNVQPIAQKAING